MRWTGLLDRGIGRVSGVLVSRDRVWDIRWKRRRVEALLIFARLLSPLLVRYKSIRGDGHFADWGEQGSVRSLIANIQ